MNALMFVTYDIRKPSLGPIQVLTARCCLNLFDQDFIHLMVDIQHGEHIQYSQRGSRIFRVPATRS
jgi:hypothetical protein